MGEGGWLGVLYWPKLPVSHLGPDPRNPQALSPTSHSIINLKDLKGPMFFSEFSKL